MRQPLALGTGLREYKRCLLPSNVLSISKIMNHTTKIVQPMGYLYMLGFDEV